MLKEFWKDIEGYEGLYQVSNLGRIKTIAHWQTYSNGDKHFYREQRERGWGPSFRGGGFYPYGAWQK